MNKKMKLLFIILLGFISACDLSPADERKIWAYPLSSLDEIITTQGVSIDNDNTKDGNGALLIDTETPVIVELIELSDININSSRVAFSGVIKTEGLVAAVGKTITKNIGKKKKNKDIDQSSKGIAYIEMLVRYEDGEELVSRGPRVPFSGDNDWRSAETILYVDKSENPQRVKLNLVVDGAGKVWIDSASMNKRRLRLGYLFWGHAVVWLVLIIYIYNLIRKNKRIKKELESLSG